MLVPDEKAHNPTSTIRQPASQPASQPNQAAVKGSIENSGVPHRTVPELAAPLPFTLTLFHP